MTVPTRDEAIAMLEEGQSAIQALFEELSDQEMTRPATIGGGDWSAKDLMGHIAFWEELAAEALSDSRAGRRPGVLQIFDKNQEGVDEANAQNQMRTATQSLEQVRCRADAAYAVILEAIGSMSDDEWQANVFNPNARVSTLAELLGGVLGAPRRPFGHVFAHLPDLEAYVNSLERR